MSVERLSNLRWALGAMAAVLFVPGTLSAESLSQPTERTRFEEAFEKDYVLPKWSGGVLLSWRSNTHHADDRHNLRVHSRDGKVIGQYRLWFPDATLLYIRDVAASEDGGVVAVGSAVNKSGVLVGYLAMIAKGSSVIKVTAVAPFEGQRIEFGHDNSIWMLGYQTGEERRLLKSPPHSLLHHYTAGGELIEKHLPWPEISCGSHPFAGDAPLLTVNAGRIGIYLPACESWLDLTATGEVSGRRPAKLPAGYSAKSATFWNAFILEDGKAYAFVSHPYHVTSSGATVHSGLFALRREQGTWESLDKRDAEIASGDLTWLAGIDRNRFVCRVGTNEFVWLPLRP